jgi:hypothetical protein
MADFKLSSEVLFINRQGDIVAAKVVKVISDSYASLVWWDANTGLQSYSEGVMYSPDKPASSTFHLANQDLTPKTPEEEATFRLAAVESSGVENQTLAPGTGQIIEAIPGIPLEQQVTPTEGKAAEKAIDPMELPPTSPTVVTGPPQEDRAGQLTNEDARNREEPPWEETEGERKGQNPQGNEPFDKPWGDSPVDRPWGEEPKEKEDATFTPENQERRMEND